MGTTLLRSKPISKRHMSAHYLNPLRVPTLLVSVTNQCLHGPHRILGKTKQDIWKKSNYTTSLKILQCIW